MTDTERGANIWVNKCVFRVLLDSFHSEEAECLALFVENASNISSFCDLVITSALNMLLLVLDKETDRFS